MEEWRGMFLENVMAKSYKVKHLMVGALRRGYVVSEDVLKQLGYQKNRLLRLGAIEETDEPVSKEPIPLGPEFNHGTHPELAEKMHGDSVAADAEDVDPDDESHPLEVSGGRVVDVVGQDRPTIASDSKTGAAPATRRVLGGEDEENVEPRTAHTERLDDMTVEQLKDRAAKLNIEGRSEMNKADLVKAVKKAEQSQKQ